MDRCLRPISLSGVTSIRRNDRRRAPDFRFRRSALLRPLRALRILSERLLNSMRFAAVRKSAFGTKRTFGDSYCLSAFGGKADLAMMLRLLMIQSEGAAQQVPLCSVSSKL
jgi:hypothetical protein